MDPSVLLGSSEVRPAVNPHAGELWRSAGPSLTPTLMVQRVHQPPDRSQPSLSQLFLHLSLASVVHKSPWALCLKGTKHQLM